MATMKYVTRLLLLIIVRSKRTITEAFVARLCKNENSIKMQAYSINNQGPVRFGKNSRLVAEKAKSVKHFERTKLLKEKKSRSSIFGDITLAKSKNSRLIFCVAIANQSKSNNDAQIYERSGVVGGGGFVQRKEPAFIPRPRPDEQTIARYASSVARLAVVETPERPRHLASSAWLPLAQMRPAWLLPACSDSFWCLYVFVASKASSF